MSNYYLDGDTVRLICTFYDWNGEKAFPDEVTLTIYDYSWKQLEQILLSEANRNTDGDYFYDYVFNTLGTHYYEWKGMYQGNTPNLERDEIDIKRI